MTEHAADAMKSADAAIAALKRQKPTSAIAARARSAELVRLQQILVEASRKVVDANAAKRLANGNGRAQPVMGEATSLSEDVIKALAEGLVPFLRETIAEAVAPLNARLDALEKHKGLAPLASRLSQLEMNSLRYERVWDAQKVFHPNMMVTYGGNLWFCEQVNSNVCPGTSDCWSLMQKTKGRQ